MDINMNVMYMNKDRNNRFHMKISINTNIWQRVTKSVSREVSLATRQKVRNFERMPSLKFGKSGTTVFVGCVEKTSELHMS